MRWSVDKQWTSQWIKIDIHVHVHVHACSINQSGIFRWVTTKLWQHTCTCKIVMTEIITCLDVPVHLPQVSHDKHGLRVWSYQSVAQPLILTGPQWHRVTNSTIWDTPTCTCTCTCNIRPSIHVHVIVLCLNFPMDQSSQLPLHMHTKNKIWLWMNSVCCFRHTHNVFCL